MNSGSNPETELFNYHAEQAKVAFQARIGSLLELQSLLDGKRSYAEGNKKEGAFLTNNELKVLSDWLTQATTGLMGDYVSLDNVNRITNKLYKCAMKIAERKSPNIKNLDS